MPGVYISYPFCNQKCTFCNFASGVASGATKVRYLQALLDEIRRTDWPWNPETLYLGGGTPSLMPVAELQKVVATIPRERLDEFTLECAPGTIDADKVRGWAELGVNRISLGVQSFVHDELRRIGRRHTAEVVAQDVALLRNAGIGNLNIDLIAGLPGQTRRSWQESLDWVERLQAPHVSVYLFEVDEDSRLGKEALLGGVRYGADLLPGDDLSAELYERSVERLTAIGIPRYEISNFAAPGRESLHNLKYWRLEPYLGFGLDAHSFDGLRRWSNAGTMEAYLRGTRSEPSVSDKAEEHFFVGLRLDAGIHPTEDEWRRFAGPIARWAEAGMLEIRGGNLRLSDRGVLLSNEVLQEFVACT